VAAACKTAGLYRHGHAIHGFRTDFPPLPQLFERDFPRLFLNVMTQPIDRRDRQFQIPPAHIIRHPIFSRHDTFLFETLSTPWCRKVFQGQDDLPSARPAVCKTCGTKGKTGA